MSQKGGGRKPRIGIYSGAFDPVHAGHVAFALQALAAAGLDRVVFLPERLPADRPGIEHYGHRVAMLKSALRPHRRLAVMEMVDRQFSVRRTVPMLHAVFPSAQLVFLMGSDTAAVLPRWTFVDRMVQGNELVIGAVDDQAPEGITAAVGAWPFALARDITVLQSVSPDISSRYIREALRQDQYTKGLLASVRRYARQQWLYVSPGSAVRKASQE